jgi:hypothetical protein
MRFVRLSTPAGARPPHPINIKGRGRLRSHHPIEHINSTFLSPTLLFQPLCFLLRLYGDLGRSKWPADLRTTLGALSLTGSLSGQRSYVFGDVPAQGG